MKAHPNTFEVLIVDQSGKSEITTVKSLVHGISYSEKLWKNPAINADESAIDDKEAGVTLHVSKLPLSSGQSPAFLLAAGSNDFRLLETFREKLLNHVLQKLGFGTSRVLVDFVSESIALDIFCLLKKVENATRGYVLKSMAQTEGLDLQQTNGQSLGFPELTNVIANKNMLSGPFKDKWGELTILRDRALSNGTFASQEYVAAEQLANELLKELGTAPIALETRIEPQVQPVAYNHAPVAAPTPIEPKSEPVSVPEPAAPIVQEVPVAASLNNHVVEEKKEEKLPEPVQAYVPPVVQEPVRQQVESAPIGNEGNFDLISESVLLQELKTAQSNESGKYVDLKAFVTKMLVPKGYALGPTYMVAKNMDEKGLVKIYETKDEKGFSVRAIRVS